MIENQKSTDHDDNNDRKRHGQTQFTNTKGRKLIRVNTKPEQNPVMNSCIPEGQVILTQLVANVVLPIDKI
jgi:uncharacterized lipoprotein YddW (UPF0748 family)